VRTAEALAKEGVVIFTIGVGTAAGSEIQIIGARGRPEYLTDKKGQVVHSRLDEPTLQAIARSTHGAYYPLGPVGEGLAKARLAIENLTTTARMAPGRRLGVERFHVPVAAVLLLLVTESAIGTRRKLKVLIEQNQGTVKLRPIPKS
jgi:Ca-activated chloride channel family protein